jgi:ATP-dependent helicase HrpA
VEDVLRHLALGLKDCLVTDRYRVSRRLRELRALLDQGRTIADAEIDRLYDAVGECRARVARRTANLPKTSYPPELPVSQKRDEIIAAIRDHQVVVVCGETGSGKTTQLPKICLDAGRGRTGIIGHTQPRRLAARSVAARIADELSVPLGGAVGYKVRFGDKTSPATVIKLMTDGILLTETQHDRPLAHYDTIIIDEAHERSLNIDFLLGYLKQLLPKRHDLKIIVTSATIDPKRLSLHFSNAPIIEVSGRTYPVEVRYRPLTRSDEEEDLRLEDALVHAMDEIHRESGQDGGDVLVFLPGEREIRQAADHLADHFPRGVEVVPLYARLSNQEQQKIFERTRPGVRRVVLSTNIAETSLTVPGIRYVIDSGFARISRYSPSTKVQRLPIEPISKASAAQRSGRCGRLGPGIAVRLYGRDDFLGRPDFTDPEILRTNLASVILQMKALRLGRIEDFPFIDAPEGRMVRDGYETLHELGAITESGDITPVGTKLARLPIDPRLGRMLLAAADEHAVRELLVITAALGVEDPRERPMQLADKADKAHEQFDDPESDFIALLNLWRTYHELEEKLTGGKLRRWCKDNFISFLKMREWSSTHDQLARLAEELKLRVNAVPAHRDNVHRAVLAGLLSSIGVKSDKKDGYGYEGCRGVKFSIFPGSGLFRKGPPHLMAAELLQTTKLYAHDAARIRPEWVESIGAHLIKRQHTEPHYDEKNMMVYAYERVTIYGLELVSRRRVHYGPIAPAIAREIFIQHALVEELYISPAPFWANNKELLAQLRHLSHKARQSDIAVDPRLVFDFYDKRLGPEVFSGSTLDLWRKTHERANPKALFMARADLEPPKAREVTQEKFPDALDTFGTRLNLAYKFDPGKDDDGLTLTVPLETLHQIDDARLEWGVPGLLPAKIAAMIEALPRQYRKELGDADALAATIAGSIPFAKGSLLDAVAAAVRHEARVEIPRDAWRVDSLPKHLRVTLRVVDEHGQTLAAEKNLNTLLARFGEEARRRFVHAAGREHHQERVTDWNFGDLPERVDLKRGKATIAGFPALLDKGTHAELTVLDSPRAAAQASRAGVRRLFILAAKDELDWALRVLPDFNRLAMLYAPLGSPAQLKDEAACIIADRVFMQEPTLPRTREAFVKTLRARWDQVRAVAAETAATIHQILTAHQSLSLRLSTKAPPAWGPAVADLRLHLVLLMHPGAMAATSWSNLRHFPRYLHAALKRLDKLQASSGAANAVERDARHMADMAALWRDYLVRLDTKNKTNRADPLLDEFKWLLEELRVSLFAQELGTPFSVSVKRLEKSWNDLLQASR